MIAMAYVPVYRVLVGIAFALLQAESVTLVQVPEGYSSRSVCVSVCYQASYYTPCLRVQMAVL